VKDPLEQNSQILGNLYVDTFALEVSRSPVIRSTLEPSIHRIALVENMSDLLLLPRCLL
jgi:hypothetical protein